MGSLSSLDESRATVAASPAQRYAAFIRRPLDAPGWLCSMDCRRWKIDRARDHLIDYTGRLMKQDSTDECEHRTYRRCLRCTTRVRYEPCVFVTFHQAVCFECYVDDRRRAWLEYLFLARQISFGGVSDINTRLIAIVSAWLTFDERLSLGVWKRTPR